MSLFQPSTKAVSAACQEIADTVGASGDGEMTTRAGRSLFAGLQHFNNTANWDFLRTEAAPITIFAPFGVTGVSASAGQASAAAPAGHGLKPDDFISGSGFAAGTRISATAASGFGIYGTVTGLAAGVNVLSATASRDMYDLPSDWKAPYTARLLISQVDLRYVGRRLYDRQGANEQTVSTPYWYDLFLVGSRGKIRLLTPPTAADILQLRYYRRMTIPTATATADVVDIVQDYEPYLIAWAKWHFLLDKGEGRGEQMKTWFVMSQEGLKTMLRDQTRIPDEGLMFIPGHASFGNWSDTTTRWLNYDY
jgi:hypothetical protein